MRSFYALLLLLLIPLTAGCRDHQETLPPEVSQILGLDRPLEVLMVSPQGPTSGPGDYESVNVVFNQPMTALGGESGEPPFRLEPEADGHFRWKGTATACFTPNQPLPPGTEYRVIVPAGTTAASGKKLTQEASFTFQTPGPRLVSSLPADNSDSYTGEAPILLEFDQSVDPTKVAAVLSLTEPTGQGQPTARAVEPAELERLNKDREVALLERRCVMVTLPNLQKGTRYTLKIDKGLVGEVGPLASTGDKLISFTTLRPLAYEGPNAVENQNPADGIAVKFSTAVNMAALKKHLTISPKVELTANDYDEDLEDSELTLYLDLQPQTEYTVTLAADLTDIHGQKLGKSVVFSHKTGDRAPYLQMADGVGVLEAKGKLSLPMGLLNIDQQTIRLALLDRDEVAKLLSRPTYEWAYGQQPWQPSKGFGVTRTVKPDGPRNQMFDSPLDLTEVMAGRKFGFVYFEVQSVGKEFQDTRRGLVQVTNLGASAKFSPENSVFMATSLDTAEPLSAVEATLTDGSGKALWSGKTGADGRGEAPGWGQLLPARSDDPYSSPALTLWLRQGEDQVYVRNGDFGAVWASGFDISTRYDSSAHQPAAQAYTERGLYLPGEEVQLKGAVRDRQGGRWVNPGVPILSFELFDSRDESVEKGEVPLSSFGTFHHTLKVPKGSATGVYRVDYSLAPTTAQARAVPPTLTRPSFRVEEFEPADFEVQVSSEQKSAAMGSTVEAKIVGNWLFGSPMNGEKVQWASYLEPFTFSSPDYPGYDFGPQSLDNGEASDTHQTLSGGKGVTDNQGRFQANVALEGIAYRGDAQLTVEGTVVSSNRRSVTGRTVIPVARGAYRLGLRPEGRFAGSGRPVKISALALSLDGKPVSGKSIKLELLRREWNSVRKSGADGRFEWRTEVEDQTVETQQANSGSGPVELSFAPKTSGYHIVRATSEDGRGNTVLSETGFYSEGADYVGWGREDRDQVEQVADKPRYQPGETAPILVKSPYQEATALVTYERDLILHSYTTKLVGSSPVIEVPLTEKHLPNLYVSVMLLRGRVAGEADHPEEDTGKPAFKMGYVDLPVSPDSQRLKVEVSTDKPRYSPGEEVVTRLKVVDAAGKPVKAELSLTAADVGVLNLIDYQTPDFFDTFYGSLPLAVRTAESRTDVIGQRSYGAKGENQGGGGGYDVGFRSDFRLTAVWKPQVVTDAQGMAEVRFRLPENLTTFRVMATAIDEETRCGKAQTELVLSKPLMLKPSLPSFARVGDEFQAGVLAANGSEEDRLLKLTVQAEGLAVGSTTQEIFLKAGEEREVLFPFKVEKEGTAVLRFSGQMGDEKDGLQVEIPLSQAVQRVTVSSAGQTDQPSHKETVKIPASAVEGSAKLQVTLASSVLGGLQEGARALLDYPYGCLEQRLSRLAPMLYGNDLVDRFGLTGWPEAKARVAVQSSLDQIGGYAHPDGGLKLWPDASEPNPYLTALALRSADLARQRGYTVADGWTLKAKGYLKAYLDRPDNGLLDFNEAETLATRAAALEALTRYDVDGRSYLNSLMDRREKMPASGKAALLEAAHRLGVKASVSTLSQELLNSLKVENATAYFDVDETLTPWLYSSDVHDTGLILTALLTTGNKPPVANKVATWLLEARQDDGTWETTANNAAALSALWEYARVFEGKPASGLRATASVAGKEIGKVAFAAGTAPRTLEQALAPGDTAVELSREGAGPLYYNITASYGESQPLPAQDQGMTILRAVLDKDGRPAKEVRGGEIYKIGLSVIAPARRRFAVLEDPVPAGFEVVKTDFASESQSLAGLLKRGDQPSWQTFARFESYHDRVLLFADALAPGEHYYEYLVRARTPGTYRYPAAQVEEMYHPEVYGRTGVGTITVK